MSVPPVFSITFFTSGSSRTSLCVRRFLAPGPVPVPPLGGLLEAVAVLGVVHDAPALELVAEADHQGAALDAERGRLGERRGERRGRRRELRERGLVGAGGGLEGERAGGGGASGR